MHVHQHVIKLEIRYKLLQKSSVGSVAKCIVCNTVSEHAMTQVISSFFQLNGALTMGTMDGANVEMCEEMGKENMFIFGMNVDEVEELKKKGYDANIYYDKNPELKQCIEQIRHGYFSPNMPGEFQDVVDVLMKWDRFFLLADYDDYIRCQDKAAETYMVRNIKIIQEVSRCPISDILELK